MDDLPSIASFFGLEEPSPESIRLVRKFSLLMSAFAVSFTISSTFWMIYIAESLGGGDYIAGLWLHLSFTWSNLSYWSTFCKERV